MDLPVAQDAVAGTYAALAAARGRLPMDALVETLKGIQGLRNVLDACEIEAMGQVAAIEFVGAEDGTLSELHHGIGHQELDAPELVAPCLGLSVHVAAARMTSALAQLTRTPALVAEQAAGRLDGHRARVVSDELIDAPPAVAAAVVDELLARAERAGGWVETAGPLRRRTAAVLAGVDATVARERVAREVERRGMSRRIESSVLDRWEGTYPVEDARVAWAAIDTVARQLLAQGSANTLAQARADAHLSLLLRQVTTTIHLHPTVPAGGAARSEQPVGSPVTDTLTDTLTDALTDTLTDTELVELTNYGGHPGASVSPDWLERRLEDGSAVLDVPVVCHPDTGAAQSSPTGVGAGWTGGAAARSELAYRPSPALREAVRLRDAHCRFPGCAITARFCDLDHVRPWPIGPTHLDNLMTLCRRHHRIKQRHGWRVRLYPDGTIDWHTPDGRVLTTHPVDHLARSRPLLTGAADLPDPGARRGGEVCARRPYDAPDDPYDLPGHSPMVEWLTRRLRDHEAAGRALTPAHRAGARSRRRTDHRTLDDRCEPAPF